MYQHKIIVKDFEYFQNEPRVELRTPYSWYSPELKKDIKRKPFTVLEDCPFHIKLNINGEDIKFVYTIPAGFNYNGADIPGTLQYISYDKHSPFVKNASLIHDFLLDCKQELWKAWDMKAQGLTKDDFRYITSVVFEIALVQNAVPEWKAKLMATFVHAWQMVLPSWHRLK